MPVPESVVDGHIYMYVYADAEQYCVSSAITSEGFCVFELTRMSAVQFVWIRSL
jgi:hypothetical protein